MQNSPARSSGCGAGRLRHFLVVEDDRGYAELIRRAFKRIDPDAVLQIANDGRKAIAGLLDTERPAPDLVVSDLHMPVMNGFELLKWIKEQPVLCRTPLIVLSSSSDERDTARAYDLGAAAYLVKPKTPEGLSSMLRAMVLFWRLTSRPPAVSRQQFATAEGPMWL